MFWINLFLFLLAVPAIFVGLPWALAHFNLGFTFVREGEAKAVMAGQRVVRFVMNFSGRRLTVPADSSLDEWSAWEVEPVPSGHREKKFFLWQWLGIHWLGPWPFRTIHRYKFRWADVIMGDDGVEKPRFRDETIDSVFVKDTIYYGKVEGAETGPAPGMEEAERLPINLGYLLTIRVCNPYKALFQIHRWNESLLSRVSQVARDYVGERSYDQLIAEEGAGTAQGFSAKVQALAQEVREEYGIEILDANIFSVDPLGWREETMKRFIASQEAEAIEITAKAKAKAVKLEGQAKAAALKSQMTAYDKNPRAGQAILDAEVGKAQGIGSIAQNLAQGLGLGRRQP